MHNLTGCATSWVGRFFGRFFGFFASRSPGCSGVGLWEFFVLVVF